MSITDKLWSELEQLSPEEKRNLSERLRLRADQEEARRTGEASDLDDLIKRISTRRESMPGYYDVVEWIREDRDR